MNHFFALPIPPAIQEELGKLAEEWQSLNIGRASWYAPADYHITLKFLGNVDPSRQPELIEAALPVAARTAPFTVDLNVAVGAFPNLRQPRVLWAGVKPNERMVALASEIDTVMAALSFARERRAFNAHITLARCRLLTEFTRRDWPAPKKVAFSPFATDQFVLMQSSPPEKQGQTVKNSRRLRYNTVRTFPFGVADNDRVKRGD